MEAQAHGAVHGLRSVLEAAERFINRPVVYGRAYMPALTGAIVGARRAGP